MQLIVIPVRAGIIPAATFVYCILSLTLACGDSRATSLPPADQPTAVASRAAGSVNGPVASAARVVYVARPDTLRGLYVNRWAALGDRMWELVGIAHRTEINTLVIDVKDDRGFVLYRSHVPLAQAIGADTNRPMSPRRLAALFDSLRSNNIYPIARIVVAKDPLLASTRLEWAIKRRADGKPWLDRNGRPWLDASQPEVWRYAVDLAREARQAGFSAVQFDYVRFPDDERLAREASFPLAHGRNRAQIIRDQLGAARAMLRPTGMLMSIDVFGLTATDTTDMGIGQRWEDFIDRADIVLPMTYPSHFAPGTYGLESPNAHPYATIDHALKDMKDRSEGLKNAADIIPWYQAFTLGPPAYGAAQVRAQIRAGYDNGFWSWILWNPGSKYDTTAFRRKQ
ncbi:MAG: putative glycoside hydrolase [Gemmatimonadota bacterium]|nr:putative glycoside hydrolase [Gemmatimonadota bacterium]